MTRKTFLRFTPRHPDFKQPSASLRLQAKRPSFAMVLQKMVKPRQKRKKLTGLMKLTMIQFKKFSIGINALKPHWEGK